MVKIKVKVTDIKQFIYCPRIIYYTYCMPVLNKTTYKMDYGGDKHERVEELEQRRTLKRYGLEQGEKKFKVSHYSKRLSLIGKLDLLVVNDGVYTPIELKYSTRKPGLRHKYQLIAYVLLMEEKFNISIRKGLIHLIPTKETFEIKVTTGLRRKVKDIIKQINKVIESELMHEPTKDKGKCKECEYLNFCGDV